MSDTKHQYSIGFEEWWAEHGTPNSPIRESLAKAAWSASALRMEAVKDHAYSKLSVTHQRMIEHNHATLAVRKEVHRDDYNRAGILIAGLKFIEKLGKEEAATASQCAGIATEALSEALKSHKDL